MIGESCATLNIVGCLSMSTIGKRCVTIKAVCIHVHISDNRGTLCDSENSCLSMSNIWIKGICVHVVRRDKFPRQLIHPSACLQKLNRFVNTFDELCNAASIGKMKKPFLIKYFFIHDAFEAII